MHVTTITTNTADATPIRVIISMESMELGSVVEVVDSVAEGEIDDVVVDGSVPL